MKFGVVNKSTIVNKFVLHTVQRNITHLALITRKTNIKLGILRGGTGKEPKTFCAQIFSFKLAFKVAFQSATNQSKTCLKNLKEKNINVCRIFGLR